MEQYWTDKKLDWKHLRMCLDVMKPDWLYIRLVGSMGGTVKVDVSLKGHLLDFRKDRSGVHMLVDGEEVFHFPLEDYSKGFSIAYERVYPDGRFHMGSGGEGNPDNPELPRPRRSYLRTVLDDHLMEIFFKGKIPLEFHRWAYPNERTWRLYRIKELKCKTSAKRKSGCASSCSCKTRTTSTRGR